MKIAISPTVLLLANLFFSDASAFVERTWPEAFTLADRTVAQMTTAEKLGVIRGRGQFNSRCVGDTNAVPRLGIPSICLQDGPAGVRLTKGVTGFPTGINAASTFSRRLMKARGVALGEEFRGKGVNVHLGPGLDIMRNPKMGRAWESAGPDPYLTGEFAYETTLGIQSTGVQACAKHAIANNQEHWRYGLSADIPDERTSREIYWYPFERAVEAGLTSVMCAYNRVNQTSSCRNEDVIGNTGILRKDLGFKGWIVSDWGATHDSATDHANAGMDMEQPGDWILIGGGVYSPGLEWALNDGSVTNSTVNQLVSRILAGFYKLGQETGFPPPNFNVQRADGPLNLNVVVRTPAHVALSKEIASASAVLLKTTTSGSSATVTRGLPVDIAKVKTVAIIGQDARMPKRDCDPMGKCNEGTMSVGWGSGTNSLEFIIPPEDAIKSFVGTKAAITTSTTMDINNAVNAARGKDVAFVFVNAMSGELLFYDVVHGNQGDRNDLALWWKGGSLVEAVAAVNPNTIVVVHSVGPVSLTWSNHANITGIIYAGAPGEQTGPSIVDVLFGEYNPRGRLPFSIADTEAAYGTSIVYGMDGFPTITYSEKLLLDYRYMDSINHTPRFPFGFGLSYTTFAYSAFSVAQTSSNGGIVISFTVHNSGGRTGTEIPQVYLGYPASAGEPKMVLRGFEEVLDLGAGASRAVSIAIARRELSIFQSGKGWVRPTGTFTVYVGASIKDIRLQGTIAL
ncbi:glycoside hydrolase family 3 protein [Pterulicium gracile]|uniref:beta-glucosidase n=1 Tax=Pterulicium gracile TaxID=1884261 RepID=A0A5C3Q0Z7_9AGAR|nr:glycoside hydrolase family 3 protein [Pterula gracilis]